MSFSAQFYQFKQAADDSRNAVNARARATFDSEQVDGPQAVPPAKVTINLGLPCNRSVTFARTKLYCVGMGSKEQLRRA
jgi:hypothetical protein